MAPIALISVSNKENLIPFAKALHSIHGFKILSSGGTANCIKNEGIPVTKVSEYTGANEILNGRVKTLHPKIHGGILAKQNDQSHIDDLIKENISPIDLVVVNLYPFKETIAQTNCNWDNAIENIDIGGPAMIRAAAKNHDSVIILTSPNQYENFLNALNTGEISLEARRSYALKAFEHTASYDIAISKWMAKKNNVNNQIWFEDLPLKQSLRYGENPHQKASWFALENEGWGGAIQLQGKELSTNNLLDLEAALLTVQEFDYNTKDSNKNAAVIIKHSNPCGVAVANSIELATKKAFAADPISSFGGIVALNKTVNLATAEILKDKFVECIVAPKFDQESRDLLSKKGNLRLLELSENAIKNSRNHHIRSILGGLLIQDQDNQLINLKDWELVTKKGLTIEEEKDLIFAWKVVRHVRSNAIVIASNCATVGIGAGQMNRVGSAKIAIEAGCENVKGSVLASDGFFPFSDTVNLAGKHGIKAIIQPGGSIRDSESIEACNKLGLAMIFTKKRHFLH